MPLHPGLKNLFQVWSRSGSAGPKFRSLRDAIRYVRMLPNPGDHRILRPDGQWVDVPAPVPTPLPIPLPESRRAVAHRNVIDALPLKAYKEVPTPEPDPGPPPRADFDVEVPTKDMSAEDVARAMFHAPTQDMSVDDIAEAMLNEPTNKIDRAALIRPTEPDQDHDERRRSRRIKTYQPAVLELNPGRMNIDLRPVVPSTIVDACESGLRIAMLEEGHVPLQHELLWVHIVGGDEGLDIPARVVWCADRIMGVRCQLIDPGLQDEFFEWLARAPDDVTR